MSPQHPAPGHGYGPPVGHHGAHRPLPAGPVPQPRPAWLTVAAVFAWLGAVAAGVAAFGIGTTAIVFSLPDLRAEHLAILGGMVGIVAVGALVVTFVTVACSGHRWGAVALGILCGLTAVGCLVGLQVEWPYEELTALWATALVLTLFWIVGVTVPFLLPPSLRWYEGRAGHRAFLRSVVER